MLLRLVIHSLVQFWERNYKIAKLMSLCKKPLFSASSSVADQILFKTVLNVCVDHSIQHSTTFETFTFRSESEGFTSANYQEIEKYTGRKFVNGVLRGCTLHFSSESQNGGKVFQESARCAFLVLIFATMLKHFVQFGLSLVGCS
jgi:hypothetical protein